tara:strand:- start:1603 stop:2013 length:411 start_codon:yes stop_codon:yes gene_type:complete
MKLSISEILKKADEIDESAARIEFIRKERSTALETVLQYCYHPSVKWLLPKGPAPFKPSEYPDAHGMLYSEARKLYLFIEGGNNNLTKTKREQIFINMLESIDKDDAALLVSIKDGVMPYRRITKKFVEKAFPGLV